MEKFGVAIFVGLLVSVTTIVALWNPVEPDIHTVYADNCLTAGHPLWQDC